MMIHDAAVKIIDAHVHLWNLSQSINSWVSKGNNPALQRNFTINDYIAEHPSCNGIVTIEAADCESSLLEVKWLNQLLLDYQPNKLKHIAYIDMFQGNDEFAENLQLFQHYPFVCGFRQIMAYADQAAYSPCATDCTLDQLSMHNLFINLCSLARNNYIFNCQMYPNQLLRIVEIIRSSKVKCIIDHCGLPNGLKTKAHSEWLTMLQQYCELASFKISGLDHTMLDGSFDQICAAMLEIIPLKQLHYGSNFPIVQSSPDKILFNYLNSVDKESIVQESTGQEFAVRKAIDEIFYLNSKNFFNF